MHEQTAETRPRIPGGTAPVEVKFLRRSWPRRGRKRHAGRHATCWSVLQRHGPTYLIGELAHDGLTRDRERHRAEAAARRRASAPKPDPRPDADHEWLAVSEVADLVGFSRPGVMKRIHSGRLPATENAGRYWVRADHLELVERARLAQRLRVA